MKWINAIEKPPEDKSGDIRYLAIIGAPAQNSWDRTHYEIVRYNEWGWHYATRDTQNMVFNVTFYIPESDFLTPPNTK